MKTGSRPKPTPTRPQNFSGKGTLLLPTGEENFANASGKKKKKKKKKGGRLIAALLTGGISEIARKQAKDTKKIVAKAAANKKVPMSKKLRAKILAKAKNKKQLIKGYAVATPVAGKSAGVQMGKAIYTNRLLKNTKAKQMGKPQISMVAPVSIEEQKEAVATIAYNNPSAMPEIQQAALNNPAVASIVPTAQEANQYAYQQDVLHDYQNQLQQQQPEVVQDIQQVDEYPEEEVYNEEIPGEEAVAEEYAEEAEDAYEEAPEEGAEGEEYGSFDSQISLPALDNNVLDIALEGDNYFSFDDFFEEDEEEAEYMNLSDEEKAAREKARAAKKEERKKNKDAKAAEPKTEKGKKVGEFFSNLGVALAANAGNITSAILNKGKGSVDIGSDTAVPSSQPEKKKVSMLTIVLGGTFLVLAVVGGILYFGSTPKTVKS